MTLEDICKDEKVRGRLSNVARKMERLEFLFECKQVELTILKPGSRLYTEIKKEIKIIQIKLDEMKRDHLVSFAASKVSEEEIVR